MKQRAAMSNTEHHLPIRAHIRDDLAAVRSFYIVIAVIGGLTAWLAAFGPALIVALVLIGLLEFYAGVYADRRLQASARATTLAWILTSEIEEPQHQLPPVYGFSGGDGVATERRRSVRRPISAEGYIVSNGRALRLPCTIENISASGAKLVLVSNETIPNTFCLLMPESALVLLVEVMWQADGGVGVQITQQAALQLSNKPMRFIEAMERAA